MHTNNFHSNKRQRLKFVNKMCLKMTQQTQRCLIIFQAYTYAFVKQLICYLSILSQHSIFIQASYYHVRNVFFFDLVYANYTGFYIINIIDCYTLSYYHTLFSCSSSFCESGKQPVVEGLTESCTMILEIMLFLASKYQFQNLCCPQ